MNLFNRSTKEVEYTKLEANIIRLEAKLELVIAKNELLQSQLASLVTRLNGVLIKADEDRKRKEELELRILRGEAHNS